MRSSSRSAAPLASVGIICLGVMPLLGGPDHPLHWAMTAGITGFGLLFAIRQRLRRDQPPLAALSESQARQAGRAILWITGIIAVLVTFITVHQVVSGGPTGVFSVALPLLGLCWLASLGVKALRFRAPPADQTSSHDRPSRRSPNWERLTPPDSRPPGEPGRHARA